VANNSVLSQDSEQVKRISEWVRIKLRDFPELNRLTTGYDHAPRHVYWAILATLSDWSSTPPFIGQDLNMILSKGWDNLFSLGVCIELLTSLGILHTRNYLSYSDGGVNVQTENPQLLQAWLQMLKNEYEQKKQRVLIATNIEQGLDTSSPGVHSEYAFVNSFFGSL
jgi:hypothetical protein